MKSIAALAAIVVAALGIVGGAIASGDRQTFVPPPDAVAESFARALIEGRYEIARGALSSSRRRAVGTDGLREWFEPVQHRLGRPNHVEAESDWMDPDRAVARARIEAQHGTAVLQLSMTRDHGLWVIDDLTINVPTRLSFREP